MVTKELVDQMGCVFQWVFRSLGIRPWVHQLPLVWLNHLILDLVMKNEVFHFGWEHNFKPFINNLTRLFWCTLKCFKIKVRKVKTHYEENTLEALDPIVFITGM